MSDDDATIAPGGLPSKPQFWQPALALVAIGVIFLLIPSEFGLYGLGRIIMLLVIFALISAALARRRGLHHISRWLSRGLVAVVTMALALSVLRLLAQLFGAEPPATELLLEAALIWLVNIAVFALWYWEIDGGGPADRHDGTYRSADLLFPQQTRSDPASQAWVPNYLDYLFLAFNTSTAFSPTDTMVLSRRAKLLMMCQALISLTTLAILAARAINKLGS